MVDNGIKKIVSFAILDDLLDDDNADDEEESEMPFVAICAVLAL